MAAKSMQEIVTVEAFEEKVKNAVTSLTRAAEEKRNAENAFVAFNQEHFNPHFNPHISRNKHIMQGKPVDISAGLGPYFCKLPRELRDQIFSHLLVSGFPNFMRISRVMEQEGKSMIWKKGTFRRNVGSRNGIYYSPSPETMNKIQNINIAIKNIASKTTILHSYLSQHPELAILDHFAGSAPHRKMCNISIETYAGGPTLFNYQLLTRLQRLTGFEEVVLRIGIKWTEGANLIKPSDSCFDTSHELNSWYSDLELAGPYLQYHLGKTDLRSDTDGWSMVFNPRKAVEEVVTS